MLNYVVDEFLYFVFFLKIDLFLINDGVRENELFDQRNFVNFYYYLIV